jgi:nucleotide-binding universal stress UspA family protein
MKDFFLNLPVGGDARPVTDYGISLARQFSAHITAAAICFKRLIVGSPFDGAAATMIAGALEEDRERAQKTAAAFDAAATGASILWETRIVNADPETASSWFAERARHNDLIICPQSEPTVPGHEELLIETALFSSGRPVLVVPYIHKGPARIGRVTVCWNGSANAARAVHDALPLLKLAKDITVLSVTSVSSPDETMKNAEIANHLARHSLQVDVKMLHAANISPADAVLSHVADSGTDLIVMGAYGHSRLREFILGGMTRDILHSMTVPTLFSH